MEQDGRLVGSFSGDNVDGGTNIIPKIMNIRCAGRAVTGQWYGRCYTPKNYYARVKTFLKEYKAPKITIPLSGEYVQAFFPVGAEAGDHRQGAGAVLEAVVLDAVSGDRSCSRWRSRFAIYGYHFSPGDGFAPGVKTIDV